MKKDKNRTKQGAEPVVEYPSALLVAAALFVGNICRELRQML